MKKTEKILCAILTVIFLAAAFIIIRDLPSGRRYHFDPGILRWNGMETDDEGNILLDPVLYDGGDSVESGRFSLGRGHYRLDISYSSEQDIPVYISLDNDLSRDMILPAGSGTASADLDLSRPTDRAKMVFTLPGEAAAYITSMDISSERLIVTDRLFQLVLLAAVYGMLLLLIKGYRTFDREKKIAVITLIIMGVIINAPLYINTVRDAPPGAWQGSLVDMLDPAVRFGIDTRAQLLRLEGVVSGLFDRQLPVIIAPNYLNECGELSFLYPDLFLYPFALMRILGASMSIAFRCMNLFVNIVTMLVMYYCCRQILPDTRRDLLATAIYLFEPHRVRVIYEKGASTGMGLPYIFVPLCIAGMYLILKKEKKGIFLLAFGVTGVLQSHITSFILLMLLLVIMGLACIGELISEGCSRLLMILRAALLALAMNLGFLLIFIWYYAHGVNTESLEWNSWLEMLLSPGMLFTDTESRFYALAIPVALVLLLAFALRRSFEGKKMVISMLAFGALFFIMTSTLFPWKILLSHSALAVAFGNYMQKPHRFYTVMASCIIFSLLILTKESEESRAGRYAARAGALLMIVAALVSTPLKYDEYLDASPLLYDRVMGDMNSRQNYNYLPLGVDQDAEFSAAASLSDWDAVESLSYEKQGTRAEYRYIAHSEGVYAEFPLLMYDGYEAEDEKGVPVDITSGDEARVRAYLQGDGEEHLIKVRFRVRPVFTLLYVICLLLTVFAVVYFIAVYERRGGVKSPREK